MHIFPIDVFLDATEPDEWVDGRWSWIHYWESRRHEVDAQFLQEIVADEAARATTESLRKRCSAKLIEATAATNPAEVRSAATLALGRIGEEMATARLLNLIEDKDDRVRESAWISLALVNSRSAREKIASPGKLSARDCVAWCMAVGLMRDPPEEALRMLVLPASERKTDDLSQHGQAGGVGPTKDQIRHALLADVQQTAFWAMRVQHPEGLGEIAERVVRESADDMLVADALLAIGSYRPQNWRTVQLLDGVFFNPWEGKIPATKTHWEAGYSGLLRNQGVRIAATFALGRYELPVTDDNGRKARSALRSVFSRRSYQGGDFLGVAEKKAGLARGRKEPDGFAQAMSKTRFALLNLGHIGYADDAELLIRMLRHRWLGPQFGNKGAHYTRRGFSALGLGYYLERMNRMGVVVALNREGPDLSDRTAWSRNGVLDGEERDDTLKTCRRALRTLVDIGRDKDEPAETRAACAIALVLGGMPERAEQIKSILASTDEKDWLLQAYGVVALAMVKDPEAINLARTILKDETCSSMSEWEIQQRGFSHRPALLAIIARRALMHGLGLIGTPEAADLARAQFGRDLPTSMQAIQTLRACGQTDLADPLLEVLATANNTSLPPLEIADRPKRKNPDEGERLSPAEQATMAAWSLGHLLRRQPADTVASVVLRDCNVTMPLPHSPDVLGRSVSIIELKASVAAFRLRCYADPVLFDVITTARKGARD